MRLPEGSLAPQLLPVRSDTSRYVYLPVLARCTHCGTAVEPFATYAITRDYPRPGDPAHTGLCAACCHRLCDVALLAYKEARERLSRVTCVPCEQARHLDCVRPCVCGGARHGRVVAQPD